MIYRSNQAYEGALKESYKVLAEKSQEEVLRKTPNDIERFFETNHIFRERVLQLFKNYRQEWRNKSTHDYKLFFDENEAFIALTSVTSFVHLLLKQIQEKIAFTNQQKKLSEEKEVTKKVRDIVVSKDISPLEKLKDIIVEFSKQNSQEIYNNTHGMMEAEIMGIFHAYIESTGEDIEVQREPSLSIGSMHIRPYFLIKIDGEYIIVELKKSKKIENPSTLIMHQILTYMQATNTDNGIIYYTNFNEPNPEPIISKIDTILNEKPYNIISITT